METRQDYPKNGDMPMTDLPNACESDSRIMKPADVNSVATESRNDNENVRSNKHMAQSSQHSELNENDEGRDHCELVDEDKSVNSVYGRGNEQLRPRRNDDDSDHIDRDDGAVNNNRPPLVEKWGREQNSDVTEKCEDKSMTMTFGTEATVENKSGTVKRYKWIRIPSMKEKRKAKQESRIQAYGIRNDDMGYVCLDMEDAWAKKKTHEVKIFDESADISRNIRAASKWIRRRKAEAEADDVRQLIDVAIDRTEDKRIRLRAEAESFKISSKESEKHAKDLSDEIA